MKDGLGRIQSVAVVGGSSEIGLAAAEALKTVGAQRFVVAGRPSNRRSAVADRLEGSVREVDLDLTDGARLQASTKEIFSEGDIDVFLLAAGNLKQEPSVEDSLRMGQVNYVGSLGVLLEAAHQLTQQGHGHLIVLSSAGVTRPRPSNFVYGSTKAAIDFAARGLALSMRESGVTVTIVRPNFVHTKMTAGLPPAPLAIRPEKVARSIVDIVVKGTEGVVWVPRTVAILARILQLLPASVVARLDR